MKTKHVMTMIAGLAVGAAAALGLLYVNPLTSRDAGELGGFDRVLRYDFPSEDVLLLTHAGSVPMPLQPVGVQELWESAVRTSVAGLVALGEADGPPAAIASKIAVPSPRTDLLDAGIVVDDNWLVTLPGQGTIAVLGHSNLWPAVKENLLPVTLLGRPWVGPRSYRTTDGPVLRNTALVTGVTGRFEAQQGSAVERLELNAYSREGGLEKFAGELHLRLIPAYTPDTDEDAATFAAD